MSDETTTPEPGALTTDTGNPSGIELRGYELARKQGERWVQVNKYPPNQYGWGRAVQDAKYYCETYTSETYRIRPIISLEPAPGPSKPMVKEEGDSDVAESSTP